MPAPSSSNISYLRAIGHGRLLALAPLVERITKYCLLIASSHHTRWLRLTSIVLQTILFVLTVVKFFGAQAGDAQRSLLLLRVTELLN